MKVHIVGTVGLPSKYGGFETLVENLVEKKRTSKLKYTVFCSSRSYSSHISSYKNACLKYIPFNANGVQSIIYDIISMIMSIGKGDAILILGVSGCVFLPVLRAFTKSKIVTNIDGLEHKREKWNKYARKFLKLSEKFAVKYSDIVIADNKGIADYIREEYGIEAKIVAYGGDHVNKTVLTDNVKKMYSLPDKYAFKVCRIEPENNIELILQAFVMESSLPLVIVGNWSVSEYSIKLKAMYNDYKNIYLLNAIYDKYILDQIRSNCTVYIHGHSAGGTNPSLVEAMNLGLPVICYDVVYNRETTKNRAIYFKDKNDLCVFLENISNYDLTNLASNMKIVANEEYCWDIIVQKYEELY